MITQFVQKHFYFKLFSLVNTILIQTIQFSISIDFFHTVKCQNSSFLNNSVQHKYSFNVKTVLFQVVQFRISAQFLLSKISLFQAIQFTQTVLI